ncbi:hypothetical protein TPA0910_68590 [Streptomyces hygroscopicus subsp. sporocinereus]|uniref:Uncharacterized protein n=1 Tax=Streptomyces hygroscopicus TaxID=1912 RepID=A0ABQ3U9Y8_STRHY|nr:hypothetical protein TPA0910_68590 [Streptomyces hygroscopicus]
MLSETLSRVSVATAPQTTKASVSAAETPKTTRSVRGVRWGPAGWGPGRSTVTGGTPLTSPEFVPVCGTQKNLSLGLADGFSATQDVVTHAGRYRAGHVACPQRPDQQVSTG